MALGTFGEVMGFAAEMVKQTETIYKMIVQRVEDPSLKDLFQALLEEEQKNLSQIEKTRRENVTEMILEPITGLHQEDYLMGMEGMDRVQEGDFLKIALRLEEQEQRFFNDVSDRLPFPEVVRIFRKIAQKKGKSIDKLKAIGLNQSLSQSI